MTTRLIEDPAPATQADIDAEIAEARGAYAKAVSDGGAVRHHPDRDYPPYRSTVLRHPKRSLIVLDDPDAAELTGPVFGRTDVTALDHDLTRRHRGDPLGERITV